MTVIDRSMIARHEAGHTAGLILSGRLPTEVRADRPEHDLLGVMRVNFDDESLSEPFARAVGVSVLCGPLAVGAPGWPPEWPIEAGQRHDSDARALIALARYLKLDEAAWFEMVREAHHVVSSDGFKHITNLIASALERVDRLGPDDLAFLLGPDLLKTYGINRTERTP